MKNDLVIISMMTSQKNPIENIQTISIDHTPEDTMTRFISSQIPENDSLIPTWTYQQILFFQEFESEDSIGMTCDEVIFSC